MKARYRDYLNLSKPILITGQTGTGKSRLAKLIYENSSINKEKFLTLHMASIKDELIESELFGHKKGSFTGALEHKNGYFKAAGKGTLFIDEVGELSLECQKKLLYSLEEKKYSPLGDTDYYDIECRIILATNQDLLQLVRENKFRKDLYYRIINFQIQLPCLKEIINHENNIIENEFEKLKELHDKKHLILSQELMDQLNNYNWPGNFRELKNILENLIVFSKKQILTFEQLPNWFNKNLAVIDEVDLFTDNYNFEIEKFEAKYLLAMLAKNEGKINETARVIGISKSALIYKARHYGINTLKIRSDNRDLRLKLTA